MAAGTRFGEDHAGGKQMLPESQKYLLIAVLALALALPSAVADAQPTAGARGDAAAGGATSKPSDPVRTGKERLGEKWSDEQRVDNCKVPPDKRGPKPRPENCPPDLTH